MWIDGIEIAGFGKLSGTSLRLSRGLNLILGANETGKSTLQDFLWAMLYGAPAEGPLSRYRPWAGGAFGGKIVYHLQEGPGSGKVEVSRDFSDPSVRMKGGAARGEGGQPEGEGKQFPGRIHLGVDQNIFLSTCLIRQGETSALRSKAGVSHRLMNIVESGDEEGSVEEAIRRIRELGRREIGTERQGILRDALERLEILIREREDALYRREDCQHDVLARRREQARWRKAERRLVRVETSGNREEALAMERKIAEIKSLQRKVVESQEIVEKGQQLPILDREGLRAIQARREGSLEALARVEADVRDLEEKLVKIRAVTEGKEAYLQMPSNAAELVGGLRTLMSTGRTQLADGEHEVRERRRELKLAQEQLDLLTKRYGPFRENFEKVLQDLRESRKKEASLETRKRLLNEREGQQKILQQRTESLRKQQRLAYVAAGLWAVGGVVTWVNGLLIPAAVLAALLVLTAIATLALMPRWIWRLQAEVGRLARRITHHKEEIEIVESVIQLKKEVYRRAGVSFPEAFRKGFEEFRALEAKIPTLEATAKRESSRFRRTREDVGEDEGDGEAVDLLRRAGCLGEGDAVTLDAINEFSRTLSEVGELRHEKDVLEGLLSLKARELETLEGQVREMEEEARVILEDAGVVSTQAFETLCAEEDRVREGELEMARAKERLRDLLGDSTLGDIEGKLAALREIIPEGMDADEEEDDQDSDETKEELRTELLQAGPGSDDGIAEHLQQEIQDAKRRIAILDSRIEAHSKGGRHLADIEADLEEVGRRIVFLKGERAVLAETERSLKRLKEDYLMRRFAPRLEEICRALLPDLTGGRYEDLRLDEDMNIRVHASGEESYRDVSHLSIGTQDQVYFILRHAIGRILSETGEPLPLILDETLVAFDEDRRRSAIDFLVDFSRKNQVILFTCHRHQAKELEESCKKAGLKLQKKKVDEFELVKAR